MSDSLKPKDFEEMVALFRAQVIGPLAAQSLSRGDLAEELRQLSEKNYRPPWFSRSRRYAPSTLERWYYRYKKYGLEGLRPQPRSDRGHGRALTKAQRTLILGIGQERPDVSVTVLLRTLIADGRLAQGEVSAQTVRRLLAEHGLDRRTARLRVRSARKRWQAALPDHLWHSDVCHGPSLRVESRVIPLRIHAILDDASRFIIAVRAFSTEREVDMLELLVQALRQYGDRKSVV